MTNVFLSYSRRQLHYAESVKHTLEQNQALTVWFDLEQLRPGVPWRDEIQRGLTESDGTVLVASQASLASPYVQLEWEHALENDKPVWVILFERCELPPHLTGAAVAIIDGSTHFEHALARLGDSVINGTQHHDAIPRNGLLGFPAKPPPGVRHYAAVLMSALIAYAALIGWALIAQVDGGMSPLLAPLIYLSTLFTPSAFILTVWGLFWARQIPSAPLAILHRVIAGATVLVGLIVIIVMIENDIGWVPLIGLFVVWIVLSGYLTLIGDIVGGRYKASDSSDMLRWLPTGGASTRVRATQNVATGEDLASAPAVRPTPARRAPASRTSRGPFYALTAHPDDAKIESHIDDALRGAFGVAVTNRAAYAVLLLSSNTTAALVQAVLDRNTGTLIPVVVSNNVSDDLIRLVGDWQIVDYRKREPETLRLLQGALYGQPISSFAVTPQSFSQHVHPAMTTQLRRAYAATPARNTPPQLTFVALFLLSLFVCAFVGWAANGFDLSDGGSSGTGNLFDNLATIEGMQTQFAPRTPVFNNFAAPTLPFMANPTIAAALEPQLTAQAAEFYDNIAATAVRRVVLTQRAEASTPTPPPPD